MRQLSILNSSEIEKHDNPPSFNGVERRPHLCFSCGILELAEEMRKPSNKVRFLVLSVYFRTQRRFCGMRFDERDLRHVCGQLGYS